jgi:hypothetical protein
MKNDRLATKRGLLVNYARQDSNLQPSVPKTDALSSCATGANRLFSIRFQSRRFKRRRGVEINRGHPRPAAELAGGCSQ